MNRLEQAVTDVIDDVFGPIAEVKVRAENEQLEVRRDTGPRGDRDIQTLGGLMVAAGGIITSGSLVVGEIIDSAPDDIVALGAGGGLGAAVVGAIIYGVGRR